MTEDYNDPNSLAFWDELRENVVLDVACSSWDPNYATKCFGADFDSKTVLGRITKVRISRGSKKKVTFDVSFPEKKYEKNYNGYDINYIWKYAREVPPKYQKMRASYLVDLARQAGMMAADVGPKVQEDPENDDSEATDSDTDNQNAVDPKEKRKKKDSARKPSKKSKSAPEDVDEIAESDVESEREVDSDGEPEEEDEHLFYDPANVETDFPSNDDGHEERKGDDAGQRLEDFAPEKFVLSQEPFIEDFPFNGSPGPKHTLSPENAVPFEYFCLFIPIYFWSLWAQYTNTKASLEKAAGTSKGRSWGKTSSAELKAWVASIMIWSYFKTYSFQKFYCYAIDPLKVKQWFPRFDRWENIKRFFKVSDPNTDTDHKEDRMWRIRELFEVFSSACKTNYYPHCEVALDEAVKKFKGRCSFKQYIKNKPIRWGIKIFALCCSKTSYLWNCAFYLGKRVENEQDQKKDDSTTQEAVKLLVSPLQGKNHILFMDNYYTSIPLFIYLFNLAIRCCGTIRTNRKGIPPQVPIKKNEESQLKKKPGYSRWASCGPICVLAWFDKRPVHMLSNAFKPDDPNSTITHWYSAKKGEPGYPGKVQKVINLPPIIKWYRKFMGAVDTFDQYRAYIKLEFRTGKFWHPMYFFIVESALINAWVLYVATRTLARLPLQFDHVQFRRSIAMSLAAEWEVMGCRNKAEDGPIASSPTTMLKTVKKGKRIHLKKLILHKSKSDSDTISPPLHMECIERLPAVEGSKNKQRQLQCVQCQSDKRTSFWCNTCKVPLHRDVCFGKYHLP